LFENFCEGDSATKIISLQDLQIVLAH